MPSRLNGIYYGWVLAVMLGITQTISWGILYYGFSAFMPAMEADLGWTRGQMSGALSLAILLSGLAAAPVGYWLDHHGPRLLMTVGSMLAAILMAMWSQVTTLVQFYALWALIGVTMAAILYEPAFAIVTAWFERHRTRAMMIVTLMAGLASTIFFPIEAWLIDQQGWRSALITLAVFLAVTTVLPHALLLRRVPDRDQQLCDGANERIQAEASARRPALSVGAALRQAPFRWLAVAFVLNAVPNIAVLTHLIPYLHDLGYETTLAATVSGLVGVTQVVGRIGLGMVGDRVPMRLGASVVLGLQALALVALLLLSGLVGLVVFIGLFGISQGAVTLVRPAFVADIYGQERYATIAGALAAIVTVATALAPVSGGVAHDLFGSYDPLLWLFVILSAISAVVVLLVVPEGETCSASLDGREQDSHPGSMLTRVSVFGVRFGTPRGARREARCC